MDAYLGLHHTSKQSRLANIPLASFPFGGREDTVRIESRTGLQQAIYDSRHAACVQVVYLSMLTEVIEDPGTKPHLKDTPISLKEICGALIRVILRYPIWLSGDPSEEAVERDLASSVLTTILRMLGAALSFSSEAADLRLSMLECRGSGSEDIISFGSRLLQQLRPTRSETADMSIASSTCQDDRNELVKSTLCLLTNILYRCAPAQVPPATTLLVSSIELPRTGCWR